MKRNPVDYAFVSVDPNVAHKPRPDRLEIIRGVGPTHRPDDKSQNGARTPRGHSTKPLSYLLPPCP